MMTFPTKVFMALLGLTLTSSQVAFAKVQPSPAIKAVRELLGKDADTYTVKQKNWRTKPKAKVILAYKRIEAAKSPADFSAKLFLWEGGAKPSPRITARGTVVPDLDTTNMSSFSDFDFTLDLAPFRIRRQETAIGVRFSYAQTYPAGESSNESLVLYEVKESKLVPIFVAEMSSVSSQRGPNDQIEYNATLAVDTNVTYTYNDLLLRGELEVSALVAENPNRADDASRKQNSCRETQRYRWNGQYYRTTEKGCTQANTEEAIKNILRLSKT